MAPREVARQRYVHIPQQLAVSREEFPLCYFFRRFVSPSCSSSKFPGHLSFLFDLHSQHERGCLELATLSAAQMAAFNHFREKSLLHHSYQNHAAAIRVLHEDLQSQSGTISDRTVASVLLLCIFTDISGQTPDLANSHSSGLYYLLERRGVKQLATQRGLEMYFLGLMRLHINSFLTNNPNYADPGGFSSMLPDLDPFWQAATLVYKTLQLRKTISEHIMLLNKRRTAIISSCIEALEEFDVWDQLTRIFLESDLQIGDGTQPSTTAAYGPFQYDRTTACVIILFRASRVMLSMSLLAYRRKLGGMGFMPEASIEDAMTPKNSAESIETAIRQSIGEVLVKVPYALGDLELNGGPAAMHYDGAAGLTILYPIILIASCPYASPEQRQESCAILERIQSTIGIKSAVIPAVIYTDMYDITVHVPSSNLVHS
ncbi:hypothetical protein GQ53DRAFT_734427 [Thozetella sp. PMI_491]|nr:hypothetical protein GQ53DRAFT_734427 [Thozetella sp. PMI_491]